MNYKMVWSILGLVFISLITGYGLWMKEIVQLPADMTDNNEKTPRKTINSSAFGNNEKQQVAIMNEAVEKQHAAITKMETLDELDKKEALPELEAPEILTQDDQTKTIENAWKSSDKVTPNETTNPDIKAVETIQTDNLALSSVKKGDQIALPAINGTNYTVTVEQVKTSASGTVSATGHIEAHGEKYSAVLSRGGNTFFGTISTPEGTYEISTVNGKGGVYAVKDLDKRINTNVTDGMKVPQL